MALKCGQTFDCATRPQQTALGSTRPNAPFPSLVVGCAPIERRPLAECKKVCDQSGSSRRRRRTILVVETIAAVRPLARVFPVASAARQKHRRTASLSILQPIWLPILVFFVARSRRFGHRQPPPRCCFRSARHSAARILQKSGCLRAAAASSNLLACRSAVLAAPPHPLAQLVRRRHPTAVAAAAARRRASRAAPRAAESSPTRVAH